MYIFKNNLEVNVLFKMTVSTFTVNESRYCDIANNATLL